jgi:hypothetical protein
MPIDYNGNAAILVDAFERVLKILMLERTHPEALTVAKYIFTFAKAAGAMPCGCTILPYRPSGSSGAG